MIIWLFEYFKIFNKCNIYYDVIFRAFCSLLSALLISFGVGPVFINFVRNLKICEVIRGTGPKIHLIKQGTPTMGGVLVLFAITISILLWADLFNRYVWYVIFILIAYGFIGFIDDYLKIFQKNNRGLNVLLKYFWLSLIALLLIVVMFILESDITGTQLVLPGFKDISIQLGRWYIVSGYLVIVGSSNSVNLSDGLDGLVIFPIVFIAFGLGLVALIASNASFANCINIQHFIFFRELVVVCAAIIGSGLGFLWFNTYPAQIFMEDVGSLSLGGVLGVISILLRQECLFFIMGGLFVLETLSVIFQVYFFKLRGYRIFRMAPVHHHFELKGYPEPRIVVRFWIITLILVVISLITLKVY